MEDEEFSTEEANAIIEMLLAEGSMEIVGFDSKTEEFTYKLTPKCAELHPELYSLHFEVVNEIAKDLWMDNIIEIIFADGYTNIAMSKEQYDYVVENIDNFDDDKRMFLTAMLERYS